MKRNTMRAYLKVMTHKEDSFGEILVYGYIGQKATEWNGLDPAEDLTDVSFRKALKELEREYDLINIRLNTPGGSFHHGNAMISAIRQSTKEIHIYNDGMAASMGADIFFSVPAKRRHMPITTMAMIHETIGSCFGNATEMRSEADNLDVYNSTAIANMALDTGMSEEDIRSKFYDGKDHFLSAQMCLDLGLISKIATYKVDDPIEEDVEKLTYKDVVRRFEMPEEKDTDATLKQKVFKWLNISPQKVAETKPAPIDTTKNDDMNIEDFKKAIADGDLKIDEVINEVKVAGYDVTKVEAPAPAPEGYDPEKLAEAIDLAVEKATSPLKQTIKDLNAKLGEIPGGKKKGVASTGDDPAKATDLDAFNKSANAAAENGEALVITGT